MSGVGDLSWNDSIVVNFSKTNDPIDKKKSLHVKFDMLYNILEAQPPRSVGSASNLCLLFRTPTTTDDRQTKDDRLH